jgi:hypothetical protein
VNESATFYNSDACVLLPLFTHIARGQPLSTKSLAPATPSITRIFLPNELEGGLARLTANGYVTQHDETFAPTGKALSYAGSSRRGRAMLKELKDVQRMLASRSTESPNGVKYPGFSEAAYDAAIETYRYSIRGGA